MAATLDLVGDEYKIQQGANYKMSMRLKSAALDFTGVTARSQIRAKYSDANPIVSFTATPGSDSDGVYVDLTLMPEQTAAIPVKPAVNETKRSTYYCYDVEAVLADSTVIRLVEGIVEVSPRATK